DDTAVHQVSNEWKKNGRTLIKPWPGVLSGSRGQKSHQKSLILGSVDDIKTFPADHVKGTPGTKGKESNLVILDVNDVIITVGKGAMNTEANDAIKTLGKSVFEPEVNNVIKPEGNGIYRTKGNGGRRPNLNDVIRNHLNKVFSPAVVKDETIKMEDTEDARIEEDEEDMTSQESSEEIASDSESSNTVVEARNDVCRKHGA
ncbi:unnamed protein product, partial [Lymnaea stagnalis]